jgi:hypothetical protein
MGHFDKSAAFGFLYVTQDHGWRSLRQDRLPSDVIDWMALRYVPVLQAADGFAPSSIGRPRRAASQSLWPAIGRRSQFLAQGMGANQNGAFWPELADSGLTAFGWTWMKSSLVGEPRAAGKATVQATATSSHAISGLALTELSCS